MQRVSVVGQSGAGKTTLARRLSHVLELPHLELDAIHWGPNWQALEREAFRERVAASVGAEGWVADGNYSAVQDLVLERADTVVWLDYPLAKIVRQLARRTVRRVVLRERLYNGNVERFAEQFLSRNSLFVWVLRTQSAKKRRYEAMMSDPGYAHLTFVRLRSRGETEAWLAGLEVDQARLHTRAPHTGTAQPHPGRIVQANCEGRSSPAPDEGLG